METTVVLMLSEKAKFQVNNSKHAPGKGRPGAHLTFGPEARSARCYVLTIGVDQAHCLACAFIQDWLRLGVEGIGLAGVGRVHSSGSVAVKQQSYRVLGKDAESHRQHPLLECVCHVP